MVSLLILQQQQNKVHGENSNCNSHFLPSSPHQRGLNLSTCHAYNGNEKISVCSCLECCQKVLVEGEEGVRVGRIVRYFNRRQKYNARGAYLNIPSAVLQTAASALRIRPTLRLCSDAASRNAVKGVSGGGAVGEGRARVERQ